MGFGGSGGGGGGSLASGTDVALNTPADNQVLSYNGGIGKWVNAAPLSVPNGGTTGQLLAKASNANQDTAWIAPVSVTHRPEIYINPVSLPPEGSIIARTQ